MTGALASIDSSVLRPSRQATGGALAYVEQGVLAGAGREETASRRLTYRFSTSHSATVYFADGRPFHRLDLRTGRDRVQHDCAPDAYTGIFAVDDGDLVVRWRARGPEDLLRLDDTLFPSLTAIDKRQAAKVEQKSNR